MNTTITDSRYQCNHCGSWHHVPSLARDCENKHTRATK